MSRSFNVVKARGVKTFILVLLLGGISGCGDVKPSEALVQNSETSFDWGAYSGDNRARKYAPFDQITAQNISSLDVAWEWESVDSAILDAHSNLKPGEFQVTPIAINGVLYTSTAMSQVAAIDAKTGKTIWSYDPQTWQQGPPTTKGFLHRGVAYWSDSEKEDGTGDRVFIGTGDGRLIALNAKTGLPSKPFGIAGEVDLHTNGLARPIPKKPSAVFGLTSPPLLIDDLVVVGGYIMDRAFSDQMPRGDVRAFDARTGELRWTFHTIPRAGDAHTQTWENESWKRAGNTNVWAPMSADDENGIIYLPVSSGSNSFYGGARLGDNLYTNSVVALDAATGKRLWHYQIVHHDLWDYDLPAAPILVDIVVHGKPIKAVVQLTKQGFAFVFDRLTGDPVWPIEERPVPSSSITGEKSSPTQPFPTRPLPYERQGLSEQDLVDFTPEIRAEAVKILKTINHGPIYTPVGVKMTALLPSVVGGSNWNGGAFDPETGILYVPSTTAVQGLKLGKAGAVEEGYTHEIAGGSLLRGPKGLPLIKPPYGRITAIDLNTGDHVWMRANGNGPKDHPLLSHLNLGPLGSAGRAAPLVTKNLLFVGEGPQDRFGFAEPKFRAYDKATGKIVWETDLPSHIVGAPMTYMYDGDQYIVVSTGFRKRPHKLIAFRLLREGKLSLRKDR